MAGAPAVPASCKLIWDRGRGGAGLKGMGHGGGFHRQILSTRDNPGFYLIPGGGSDSPAWAAQNSMPNTGSVNLPDSKSGADVLYRAFTTLLGWCKVRIVPSMSINEKIFVWSQKQNLRISSPDPTAIHFTLWIVQILFNGA